MIECKHLASSCIYLVPPRSDDAFSKGYQLHVPVFIDGFDKELIYKKVKRHQLALKEIDDKIIIYKPTTH